MDHGKRKKKEGKKLFLAGAGPDPSLRHWTLLIYPADIIRRRAVSLTKLVAEPRHTMAEKQINLELKWETLQRSPIRVDQVTRDVCRVFQDTHLRKYAQVLRVLFLVSSSIPGSTSSFQQVQSEFLQWLLLPSHKLGMSAKHSFNSSRSDYARRVASCTEFSTKEKTRPEMPILTPNTKRQLNVNFAMTWPSTWCQHASVNYEFSSHCQPAKLDESALLTLIESSLVVFKNVSQISLTAVTVNVESATG